MNKRLLFIFLYFLVPFMVIIPPIYAVPTVNVVEPNGGEPLSGLTTIEFNVSTSATVTSLLADINLSTVAGEFSTSTIANDLNLLDPTVCDFDLVDIWTEQNEKNGDYNNDYIFTYMFEKDNEMFVIGKLLFNPYWVRAFKWVEGSNSWEGHDDLNVGLPSDVGATPRNSSYEFFHIGSEFYAIGTYSVDGTGARILLGYHYMYDSNTWVSDSNIIANLPEVADFAYVHAAVFEFGGKTWMIYRSTRVGVADYPITQQSFWWDGITNGWQRDDYLEQNWDIYDTSPKVGSYTDTISDSVVFTEDGVLKALVRWSNSGEDPYDTQIGSFAGLRFNTSIGQWQADSDVNRGVSTDSKGWFGVYADFLDEGIFFIEADETEGDVHDYKFVNTFDTTETADCSVSWDTTLENNHFPYFIDINAFDSVSGDVDSSDAGFSISNWENSDIECDCVANCSSCTLDVNSFVVIPSNNLGDVEIKINNKEGGKVLGFKIRNSNNSGDQYKVNTASVADFGNGVWNFSDTLTFGATTSDPVQKIWLPDDELYQYFFDDLILSDENIYFQFEYYEPAFHFFSVEHPDWDNQLAPNVVDLNEITADLFFVSTFSNMASVLNVPEFPAISSNVSNANHVLQFTARADSDVADELKAGVVSDRNGSASTSLDLVSGYTTFSIDNINGGFAKIQSTVSTSREFWFQNYVIAERGFFTKSLKILDSDGSELPVLIGDNNTFSQYIIEGKSFKIHSEYFDPDGEIDRYEVTAYIGDVDSANAVKKWFFDVSSDDDIGRINENIAGLIDLTADAPDRTVRLTLRLIDDEANYYEIQSKTFTLRQFPNTPHDLSFQISIEDKKIGDHPKGRMFLETVAPENIIGVELHILDSVSDNNNADYNTTFYKDTDFTCFFQDCSFDFLIEDYVFPSADEYRFEWWVLVKTENKGNTFGTLLHDFRSIRVSWINFDTARIFQVMQRDDHTYRNDEIIPIVVQLRDSTGRNLKDSVYVKMQLSECDAPTGGACRTIDLNYIYDSHLSDDRTGYNYYFFKQLLVEEDFTPLSDGNYFRFKAFIEDPAKVHQTLYQPVLADKCQTINPLEYFANLLTMDFYKIACNSGGFTDLLVSLPDNNSQEETILIDATHSVTAPDYFLFACIEPDQNNLYEDGLGQDVLCYIVYNLSEQPIDKFNIVFGNQHSNLEETNEEFKQFIDFDIPFELIYTNDLYLMKQALADDFQTDTISTFGEFANKTADYFLGALAPIIEVADDGSTATNIILNQGFDLNFNYDSDAGFASTGNDVNFDFSTPLDPNNLTGIILVKFRNINVINKRDFEAVDEDVKRVKPDQFVEYADSVGLRLRSKPIEIEVFVSDFVKVMSIESDAKIIVDEDTGLHKVNVANADINNLQFLSTPRKMVFRIISDMIYANETLFERRYLLLPFRVILEDKSSCGFFGINCVASALVDASEDPAGFFITHFFTLMVIVVAVLFVSLVVGNFRKKGGTTINMQVPFRRGR